MGVGGYFTNKEYFHLRTPDSWKYVNIAYMEMWALIIAVRAWGAQLRGCKVLLQCDNESVVMVLNHGRSRDLFLQAGMREMVYLQAVGEFEIKVEHLSSQQN